MPVTQIPKVLVAIASAELGGGTTHVLQLLDGLDRGAWSLTLLCDPTGPLVDAARARDIEVVTLPFMRRRLQVKLVRDLRRMLSRERFDLVHAHGSRAGFALSLAGVARASMPPLVYTEHGLSVNVPRGPILARFARAAEARTVRAAERIIALSESTRGAIAALDSTAADRTRVIPHAISPHEPLRSRNELRREIGVAPNVTLIGTVCRLSAPKAPHDLVAAAEAVCAQRDDVHFLVVGDGPLRARTEAHALRANLPFTFLGDRDNARMWLEAMDVFCLTSHWESLPLSILEAMAAGLPIVATRVGGVETLVGSDGGGILVPRRRPGDVASALLRLASDPGERQRLGSIARHTCEERHTLGRMLDATSQVYAETLGATGRSSRTLVSQGS